MQVPVGVRWGYGGKLIRVSNGKDGGKVMMGSVKSEEKIVKMAQELRKAADTNSLKTLLETKLSAAKEGSDQQEAYQALLRLFSADSRAELIKILGFEKGDVEAMLKEGVLKLKEKEDGEGKVVSFKEPANVQTAEEDTDAEAETEVRLTSYLSSDHTNLWGSLRYQKLVLQLYYKTLLLRTRDRDLAQFP
jgi:hypothetical protein